MSWRFPSVKYIVADTLYIIRSGQVVVQLQGARRDLAGFATLGPGQIFGEMGLIAGAPRSASVVAQGTVAAWSLSLVDLAPGIDL